jgi:hypothetical protein
LIKRVDPERIRKILALKGSGIKPLRDAPQNNGLLNLFSLYDERCGND